MPKQKSKAKRRRIKFYLDSPGATSVSLVGGFNNWDSKIHPMKMNKDGIWEKVVILPPGRYEYRFFVDGQWRNDPKNDQVCANSYGSQNNIITVSAK